jgi:hypothetical protein
MTVTQNESPTVVADDDVRLWAARSGSGEPLVLCHGGPGLWDYPMVWTDDPEGFREAVGSAVA